MRTWPGSTGSMSRTSRVRESNSRIGRGYPPPGAGRPGAGGERTSLEGDRQCDRRTGLHAPLLAESSDQVLEGTGRRRAHLQDVVRLARDAVAVLDLGEL